MRLPAPLLLLRIDEGAAVCDRIGMALLLAGVLVALHPLFSQAAAAGSGVFIVMACSAHASIIATLAASVALPGRANQGFTYLRRVGRSMVNETILPGAAVVAMAGSARRSLARRMECV